MDSLNKIFLIVLGTASLGAMALQVPAIQTIRNDVYDAAAADDLQTIDNDITTYSQDKDKLPDTLEALASEDIEHGLDTYRYKKTSSTKYQLCTTFKTDTISSDDSKKASSSYSSSYYTDYTSHPKGEHCFDGEVTLQSSYDSSNYLESYCEENASSALCSSDSSSLFNSPGY